MDQKTVIGQFRANQYQALLIKALKAREAAELRLKEYPMSPQWEAEKGVFDSVQQTFQKIQDEVVHSLATDEAYGIEGIYSLVLNWVSRMNMVIKAFQAVGRPEAMEPPLIAPELS